MKYEVIKELVVRVNRWEVYRVLLAMCNDDTRFGIQAPMTDDDLESITVASWPVVQLMDGHARGAVYGTVRLLKIGERTAVRFVDKDVLYRVPPNDYGKRLFREFAEQAEQRFAELQVLNSAAEMEEGKKRRGRPMLTEEDWQERFGKVKAVERIAAENNIGLQQACAREGVPYTSFRDWRRKMTEK